MAKKLGVLIIHGMGDPEPSYADGLIRRLEKRLGPAANDVVFGACYWAPILQEQQDVTWRRILQGGDIDQKAFRRWVMSALGDPATYLSGFFKAGQPVYGAIHDCIRATLARIATDLGGADDTPLVILAHSLGSVIVGNYFWDEAHKNGIGTTPFERMETLTGFISYGSNIPLFLPPSPPVMCIRFPSPRLPASYAGVAAWENVYDPDDVLGYPLRNVWDDTQGTVITDITINAGVWPVSETPFSHTLYDRDDDFLDIVQRRLQAILALP